MSSRAPVSSSDSSSDALLQDIAHVPDRPLPVVGEPRVGDRVGRFEILEKLGRGGMGVVYAARDDKLGRVVALKVLHGDGTFDSERRRRLVREARAASAVVHPGIATVFDVGEIDGRVFVALERVRGHTLREELAGRPLPVAEAVRIGASVARALGAAHDAGIVHRDLKPDNVMIADDGAIKLVDFGLAKPVLGEDDPAVDAVSEELTREGRILGTPSYMSPEQANGLAVDRRSDVFSLGVLMYEMLAGARPFTGPTRMSTLIAITRDRPLSLARRRQGIPGRLVALVERCLEKEPLARPRDGNEVAAELERALARTPWRPSGLVVVLLGICMAAAAFGLSRASTPVPPVARAALSTPMLALPIVRAAPSAPGSSVADRPAIASVRLAPKPPPARSARNPPPVVTASARPAPDPLAVQK